MVEMNLVNKVVLVDGRTWGINLGTLVELAQAADAQREARLQR